MKKVRVSYLRKQSCRTKASDHCRDFINVYKSHWSSLRKGFMTFFFLILLVARYY